MKAPLRMGSGPDFGGIQPLCEVSAELQVPVASGADSAVIDGVIGRDETRYAHRGRRLQQARLGVENCAVETVDRGDHAINIRAGPSEGRQIVITRRDHDGALGVQLRNPLLAGLWWCFRDPNGGPRPTSFRRIRPPRLPVAPARRTVPEGGVVAVMGRTSNDVSLEGQ